MKKKILIAANSDLRYDRRLQRIASALEKGGYEVSMLGRAFGSSFPEENPGWKHLVLWIQKGKLAYLELNIRLFLDLIFRKTDAICSVDLDTLPACRMAAGMLGCKLVQDSHEYMAEVPEVSGRPLTQKVWHLIARNFLPACDLRYTISLSLVEEFRRIYKSEFSLIRNMPLLTEKAEWRPMPEGLPERGFLVYLGAVNQGRGLEEILEVLAGREEQLVIVGEGDKSPEIEALIQKFQLRNRVFMTGKLLPSELPGILRNALAGINLLRDEGLSYRYSLANKFFDYVHAGIPQICIDFPEYRSLMSEYEVGVLCSLSKNSIHEALNKLQEEQLVTVYRENASRAKNAWNWQCEESELLRLYDEMFALPV